MVNKNRDRDDAFDDDNLNPPSSDSTGTIIGTVIATTFGIWATVIGTIGLIYVLFFFCVMAFFLLVFCILGTIMFTAVSRMPPPSPVITQPNNTNTPTPLPINPQWKDAALTRTYLSDLPEVDAKVGWGRFGKKGMLGYGVNPGEIDSPITFQGQRDPEALSTAPSPFQAGTVKYRLNGQYKLFKASIACNDLDKQEWGSRQPMTFRVYGDGDLLWVSEPVRAVDRKQDVRLSVEGVNELELRVECRTNSMRGRSGLRRGC